MPHWAIQTHLELVQSFVAVAGRQLSPIVKKATSQSELSLSLSLACTHTHTHTHAHAHAQLVLVWCNQEVAWQCCGGDLIQVVPMHLMQILLLVVQE